MITLTRRRSDDSHQEGWAIYFGDVRIGQISKRAGAPTSEDQWGWILGFLPGTKSQQAGSAPSFEEARGQFERAWHQLAPTLTEEQYERWRQDRDFHAWKRRMWEAGCRMPTQNQSGRSRCFCGSEISIACEEHVYTIHRGIGA